MEGLQYALFGTAVIGMMCAIKSDYLEVPLFRFFAGFVFGSSLLGSLVMIAHTFLS